MKGLLRVPKMKLSSDRIGAGIVLLLALLSVGNHYLEWRLFAERSRVIMVGMFVLLFIYLAFIGPALEGVQARRKNQDPQDQIGRPRRWLYLLTLSVIMLGAAAATPGLQLARGVPIQREDCVRLVLTETLVAVAGIVGWYRLKRVQGRR